MRPTFLIRLAAACLAMAPLLASADDSAKPCAAPDTGYTIERSVRGPIGKPDAVDACIDVLSAKTDPDAGRRLRIYTGDTLALASDDIILCKQCGGVYGDPFETLEIKRGSLIAGNYGGSRDKWGDKWVLTQREGRWIVAGWDILSADTMTGMTQTQSVNALSGEIRNDYIPPQEPEPGDTHSKRPSHRACTLPAEWRSPPVEQIGKLRERNWECGAKLARPN
jgi:hypothetical protein